MALRKLLGKVVGVAWTDSDRFVRRRLAAVLLLVTSAAMLTALGPLALKWLVDGFTGRTAGIFSSPFILAGAYALSQFLGRALGEVRGLVYARAERRLFRTLSERFFSHLIRLPLRFHLERKTGAISQSLENGLTGYQMVLHHVVFTFLPVIVELATIIVVLVRLVHPVFLVLFCGALACYCAVFARAARVIGQSARSASAAEVDAAAKMTDAVLNVEIVKCFAAESVVQQRVGQALWRTETQWVAFYRRFAVNGVYVAVIFGGFVAVTTLYAVREVQGARLSVGDFVLITAYMLQVIRPVEALGYAMQGFSQGAAMLELMFGLLHERPEPARAREDGYSTEIPTYKGPGELEFENVGLCYAPQRAALEGVSFKIAAGKTWGIVGASGSGKSTLVRLLLRLLEPDSGRILLDGVPIAELPLSTLREAIAVVPQDCALFNDSIAENIAFGRMGCTQEEIEQAASLAHLREFIASLPDGYATNVGERGLKLSGGERQRLSIARAAIKDPRIYIFDEVTAALDAVTEAAIVQSLREVSCSITTLIISHRLATVAHADEIIVLESGRVLERGSHAAMLKQRGRYAAMWARSNHGDRDT